ncbi:MAG: hypothetical protein H0W44_02595 [Gammaproteobacteria bacterium]|nr:hypothetical protein [Gammaproteobacteria bacterium]
MNEQRILLEAWKQSLRVQMAFNEIVARNRVISVALITVVLMVDSVWGKKEDYLALAAASIAWAAFYLLDRFWYLYLQIGAVQHTQNIEAKARDMGMKLVTGESLLGLTIKVTRVNRDALNIRPKYKIDLFYGVVLLMLLSTIALRYLFLQ